MENYPDEINHRLATIVLDDNFLSPTETRKPEDEIFGILGESGQKMFILWKEFLRERDAHIEKTVLSIYKPSRETEKKNLCLLSVFAEEFFWSKVHKEFPKTELLNRDDLYIAEGFFVMKKEKKDQEMPAIKMVII